MGSCWSESKDKKKRFSDDSNSNSNINSNNNIKYIDKNNVDADVSETGSVRSNNSSPRSNDGGHRILVEVPASPTSHGGDPLLLVADAPITNAAGDIVEPHPAAPSATAVPVSASPAADLLLPGAVSNPDDNDDSDDQRQVTPQNQQHQQQEQEQLVSDSASPLDTRSPRSDSSGSAPPSVHHSSDDDATDTAAAAAADEHAAAVGGGGGAAAPVPESPLSPWAFVKKHKQEQQEQQQQQGGTGIDRFASSHDLSESPLSVASTKGPDEFLPSPCMSDGAWSSSSSSSRSSGSSRDAASVNSSGVRQRFSQLTVTRSVVEEGDARK